MTSTLLSSQSARAESSSELFNKVFGHRKKIDAQQINAPLIIDGQEYGTVNAEIGQEVPRIELKGLISLLLPVMQSHLLEKLKNSVKSSEWVDINQLCQFGLTTRYSEKNINFEMTVPMAMRETQTLNFRNAGIQNFLEEQDRIYRPMEWSLISNLRWLNTQQFSNSISSDNNTLYAEAASRISNWVIESNWIGNNLPNHATLIRQDLRVTRDWTSEALRLSTGDNTTLSHASNSALALGGIRFGKVFGLDPTYSVQSQPETMLSLPGGAAVDVKVNGMLTRTLRLDPGVYRLSDIPVYTGANAVELNIVEPNGAVTQKTFDYFFDNNLLKSDVDQYEFAVGYPVDYTNIDRKYDTSRLNFTGWWRRGLFENLTAGTSFQAQTFQGKAASIVGLDAVLATQIGNIAGWIGKNNHPNFDGSAASLQWQWNTQGGKYKNIGLSVALQATWSSHGYASINTNLPGYETKDIGLRLSGAINRGISGTLSLSHRDSELSSRSASAASLTLRKRFGRNFSGELFVNQLEQNGVTDRGFGVSLSYSFSPVNLDLSSSYSLQSTASYLSSDQATQVSGNVFGNNQFLGGSHVWQAGVSHVNALSHQGDFAQANIRGGRFEGNIFISDTTTPLNQNSTLIQSSIGSGVVLSPQGIGWGAPVRDSAVLFVPNKGYEDLKLLVNPQGERAALNSDRLGTPILADINSYVPRQLQLDFENLPSAKGLGIDRPILLPYYRSVISVPVGSNARTQITGQLVECSEKKLSLQALFVIDINKNKTINLFTNRKGGFTSEPLPPGHYEIKEPGNNAILKSFTIDDESEGLLNLGKIMSLASPEKCLHL